jgi:large subunit ribosomal protein L3
MTVGLLAKKLGMTQLFLDDGLRVPVTVLQFESNRVVQKKTIENDGYLALQIGAIAGKPKQLTKAQIGHFKKADVPAQTFLREFRVNGPEAAKYSVGDTLGIDLLNDAKSVDVAGVSKGKGTAGVMKRHNMKGFRATHGTHEYFRHGGSIGCRATPGKVHKGKRMSGRMGDERVTVINLSVVKLDAEKGLLFLRGAVPGAKGGLLEVLPSQHKAQKGQRMTAETQEKSKNPMKASKAGGATKKK